MPVAPVAHDGHSSSRPDNKRAMHVYRIPIADAVRPTTVIESVRLNRLLAASVTLVSETFQHTGSFKFRAAYSVAAGVPQAAIITASSGNFGQALAYACSLLGKSCLVVMPDNSSAVKVAAIREYGGAVELVDTRRKSRAQAVQELAAKNPGAYVASAYDDDLVIYGNATLGREICAMGKRFDFLVVPIGGGGLSAGILTGIRGAGRNFPVIASEPLLANDAARSLRSASLVADCRESATIADGARTLSLGARNWEILKNGLWDVIEVPDETIEEAVRYLFFLANLKAEPTGALGLAAILTQPERFAGKAVCCVVSGGNVDNEVYRRILAGQSSRAAMSSSERG